MRASNKKLTQGGMALWARILFWTFFELAMPIFAPKKHRCAYFLPTKQEARPFWSVGAKGLRHIFYLRMFNPP
jgi:hypothetical protein